MKRLVLFILIAVLGMAPALYSQTVRHDQKQLSFGMKYGLNLAKLIVDSHYDDGYWPQFGHVFGAFSTYKINTNFGVSAELLYSQQGQNRGVSEPSHEGITLHYLNIPLLANWYVPGATGLTIKAGLQPGFFIAGMYSGYSRIDEQYNSMDISIPLGISYEFDCGLLLDLRYNIGLANVWKNEEVYNYYYDRYDRTDYSIKNHVLQLTIGARF